MGLVSFFAIPTIALTGAGPLATARHSLVGRAQPLGRRGV